MWQCCWRWLLAFFVASTEVRRKEEEEAVEAPLEVVAGAYRVLWPAVEAREEEKAVEEERPLVGGLEAGQGLCEEEE